MPAPESAKAARAFAEYLKLGEGRSLPKLLHTLTSEPTLAPVTRRLRTLEQWSADYEWVRRARAYDDEIRQKELEDLRLADQKARADRIKMRQTVVRLQRQIAIKALTKIAQNDSLIDMLEVDEINALVQLSNREERLDTGDVTDRRATLSGQADGSGPLEIRWLSEEESAASKKAAEDQKARERAFHAGGFDALVEAEKDADTGTRPSGTAA